MRRGILDGIPGTLRYLANKESLVKAGTGILSHHVPDPSLMEEGTLPNFNGNCYDAVAYAVATSARAIGVGATSVTAPK